MTLKTNYAPGDELPAADVNSANTQVNNNIASIANRYTKSEVDSLLSALGILKHRFTSESVWSALSLSGAELVQVIYDCTLCTNGGLYIYEDDELVDHVLSGSSGSRILYPSSSLAVEAVGNNYDFENISYDSKSFSCSSQSSSIGGVAFSSDGTKMYVVDTSNTSVIEYTLSTAWDVSTASYNSVSFSVFSQLNSANDICFSSDGTKMYVLSTGDKEVAQYTLSTAWTLSTASYANKNKAVTTEEANPYSLFFSLNGKKMYILGLSSDSVRQYTLSTAWDVSTASYDSVTFSVSSETNSPVILLFSADGKRMLAGPSNALFQYTLSTAWDVSTASYDSITYNFASQSGTGRGAVFSSIGDKLYFCSNSDSVIYQYNTGSVFSGSAAVTVSE